jgi:hypothetical protein
MAGTLSLAGGAVVPAMVAGASQTLAGTVVIDQKARFDIPTIFDGIVTLTDPADELRLTGDSTVSAAAKFNGGGVVRNSATLNAQDGLNSPDWSLISEGTLRVNGVGPTTGAINLGRLTLTGANTLNVELAGATPGLQFDRISVARTGELNGELALAVFNNYDPVYLFRHEIIHAADGVGGFFATISGHVLAPTKYLAVSYDADSVFVQAAIPGDANLDGQVNIADFAVLAANFNAPGPWTSGNFNGDPEVEIGDFALLAGNFNTAIPPSLRRPAGDFVIPSRSAVPEPGAGLAMLFGLFGLGRLARCFCRR